MDDAFYRYFDRSQENRQVFFHNYRARPIGNYFLRDWAGTNSRISTVQWRCGRDFQIIFIWRSVVDFVVNSAGIFPTIRVISMQVISNFYLHTPQIHISVHKFLRLLSYTASYF